MRALTAIVAIAALTASGCRTREKAPVESNAQSILSYQQYAAIDHKTPYILEFAPASGALLIYGSEHTGDVKHPEIADIQSRWASFHPTVAYNEGGNPPTEDDKEEAVKKYGEPGLLRFLAGRDQIPVATFEPSFDDEINFLRNSYRPQQIKVFYALQQVTELRLRDEGIPVDKKMDDGLKDYLPRHGLKNSPNDLTEFTAACKSLFPGLEDWHKVSENWFDPTQAAQYTNKMANDAGMFRDQKIFQTLVNRVHRGDRVFVVIGEAHVVVQEPALVKEFGTPKLKLSGLPPSQP